MSGLLIAFEGIDGSGKSTQFLRAVVWTKESGYRTACSFEPNDQSNPTGKLIRQILDGEVPAPKNPAEFQRLYVIDRAQDFFCYVKPYLEKNGERIYFVDRFGLSTIAYGMLSEYSADYFIELHKQIIGPEFFWPNLNIIIDLPADLALKRIGKERDRTQMFEKIKTLDRIRQNYLTL